MHGKRSPARLPPRLNRGAAAWDRDEFDFSVIWLSSRHSLVLPVVTRAQVHAVTDTTNQEYLAIVNAVLDEIEAGVRKRKWIAPSSLVELDAILSAICDELIYLQRKGPAHGQKLHAAWSHVYPNQMSELHSFSRSCTGWNRMLPGGEGFGLCAERWAAIGRTLLSFPGLQARECGFCKQIVIAVNRTLKCFSIRILTGVAWNVRLGIPTCVYFSVFHLAERARKHP